MGDDVAIRLRARDDRSGTFDTFKPLLLESRPLAAGAKRYEDSGNRADSVARELEAEGVGSGEVTGFGAAQAVANNDSDEGRRRNRRVEVWIR